MSDIAFKDRWKGSSLFAELQSRLGDLEIDWTELEGLADDRPGASCPLPRPPVSRMKRF